MAIFRRAAWGDTLIRVQARPEYPGFDAEVRQPGAAFLVECPAPNSKEFGKKNFWTRAAKELHAAYGGICAYTAMYLTEQGSVDHFHPKNVRPDLAYEWSNYRLASGRVNNAKGSQAEILDPFTLDNDWFYLDLPSCMLKPNPTLDKPLRARINNTINGLKLNQDDYYAQERCNILIEYATGEISLNFLVRRYPFLGKEVTRQGHDQAALRTIFSV
jgi:hypothetical protein